MRQKTTGAGSRRRAAAVIAGAAVAAALVPEAASAAVVSHSGGVVTYQAAAGELNQPFPFVDNGRIRIQEANAATPLTAGVGCVIVTARVAECTGGSQVRVNLGDGDDAYYGTGAGFTPAAVNGEAGNDIFFDGDGAGRREVYSGGAGRDLASYFLGSAAVALTLDGRANDGQAGEGDTIKSDVEDLDGGPRADTLTGNSAANRLRGGSGDDRLTGLGGDDFFEEGATSSGADVVAGGSGVDRVLYRERTTAGVRVSLDGAAGDGQAGEGDNILPDVENVTGTRFADTLLGSDIANTFAALAGNDAINPLGGADVVFAGDGDDAIDVRDGIKDYARGSAGADSVRRDRIDDAVA